MNENEKVVWDAEFNDAVTTYWLTNGIIICVVTVFGIVLLPIWIIVGKWATRKYLASHKCTLTSRQLNVSKGIFTQIEKTVPLDRITDVGIVQGPLMRFYGVESLSVETAGQSAVGSLIYLTGVQNGREFKEAILKQRDLVVGSHEEASRVSTSSSDVSESSSTLHVLEEIRDTLARIESNQDKNRKQL